MLNFANKNVYTLVVVYSVDLTLYGGYMGFQIKMPLTTTFAGSRRTASEVNR